MQKHKKGQPTPEPRMVVIGWDAGCLPYLEPLLSENLLPNLAKIMDEGTFGELVSTIPPMTPVAWTSILTGCNPGKHGVFDWWRPVGDAYELAPYDASSVRLPTLFQLLSGSGLKVGAVNVPMTAPAAPVNGFTLGGISHPNEGLRLQSQSVYPRDLSEYLEHRHTEFYKIGPDDFRQITTNEQLLDLWSAHEARRLDVIDDLVNKEQPDLLWIHCHVGDYFGHRELKDSAVLRRAFQLIDTTIGRMQEHAGSSTAVWVLSDHGQTEIKKFILIHNWLERHQLTVFRPEIPKDRFGNTLLRLLSSASIHIPQKELERVVLACAELNYGLPPGVQHQIARFIDRAVPGALKDHRNIDWEKTRAYCCDFYGQIRINVKGRDPKGVVSSEEYNALVTEICDGLSKLKDPVSDRHVGVRAYPRDALYSGAALEDAPDILCELTDYSYFFCPIHSLHLGESCDVIPIDHDSMFRTFRFLDQNYRGDHTNIGFFAAMGKGIAARGRQRAIRATDMAPTLLRCAGFLEPSYMDGIAQTHLLESSESLKNLTGSCTELVGDLGAAYSKVVEELRTLGYRL